MKMIDSEPVHLPIENPNIEDKHMFTGTIATSKKSVALLLLTFLFCACSSHIRRGDPLADLARTRITWKEFGRSVEGNPIYGYETGSGERTVLVLGGTHGDEEVGAQVVVRLAEEFSHMNPGEIPVRVLFVPVLNPDGTKHNTRTNARGVDVNRNFPTKNWTENSARARYNPGPSPASEPETKLVINILEQYKPSLIISIHSALHMINYDGPAEEVAMRMARHNGYKVSSDIGYPTPGSFGTYAGVERNIPVITLELPAVQIDEAWKQNREALLEAILR